MPKSGLCGESTYPNLCNDVLGARYWWVALRMKSMHTPNLAAIAQVSDADKWLIDRPHAQLFLL